MAWWIGNRRFAAPWWAFALTMAGIALFLRLGIWQLDRAGQKRALEAQFRAGTQSTVALHADAIDALPRYQHVRATGRYDVEHQILLDNMPSAQGRPGYRVLTPLDIDGAWLLVDRGWVPAGPTRADLPDVTTGLDAGPRTVKGRLDELPRPGLRLGENVDVPQGEWPRVQNFPTMAEVERALGRPVLPRILLLDPTEPDGYERVWEARLRVGPERHIGYAVQWFAFAALAVIVFVVVNLRRDEKRIGTKDDDLDP